MSLLPVRIVRDRFARMSTIRALERGDVPRVANLLRQHLSGWSLDENVLAAMTLQHPWHDGDLPSLVALGDGEDIVGFIGAQARRIQFRDRRIRGVCCTQLVVAPDRRAGAVGALLLRQLLAGPQEVTWSDSATDTVVRMWQAFGGHVDHARAADFMLVLRPLRWVRGVLAAVIGREGVGRRLVPVRALPVQAASRRITGLAVRPMPMPAEVRGVRASAAEIVGDLAATSHGLEARVDWDEGQLEHVLEQVARVEGDVDCRIVQRAGRPIGWYAYLPKPGGVSRVLHLAAAKRAADDVLAELIAHAAASGSAVIAGRAEPHLEAPLRRRHAALGFARQPVIRASDPELASSLATGESLLTRLDGEVFAV